MQFVDPDGCTHPTRYNTSHKPSVDSLQLDSGLGNKRRITNSQEAPKAKRQRDSLNAPTSHDTLCLRIARNGKFNDAENKKLIDHAKMIVDFLMHGDPTNYPSCATPFFSGAEKIEHRITAKLNDIESAIIQKMKSGNGTKVPAFRTHAIRGKAICLQ
ncbi:hypothetical protein BDD12DRAFT_391995 [Trichophaea hybrida]|nr:hypothetical protein BDD12DRAFT_391995 [Trichophaea hybrida]